MLSVRSTRARTRIVALASTSTIAISATVAVEAQAAHAARHSTTHAAAATLYATGMKNVTSMAWGDGAMFVGDSGSEGKTPNGGVYVIANGKGTEIPNGPAFVGGMAWHSGALYLSDAVLTKTGPSFQIARWSGFNGTTFTKQQVLYTAPAKFEGFNGIAFGPNGRLYVGADAGLLNGNDHGPASTSPYLYDILTMTAQGKDVKVYATGIRQPWQMAFAAGSADPFVSDLGQDGPSSVKNPPDFVLKVKPGQDYGFPTCSFTAGSSCAGAPQPFKEFKPHTSIMGMAIIGKTLYMTSFGGVGGSGGGAVLSMPTSGGAVKTVASKLPIFTDALAAHNGVLYAGGSTSKGAGEVYSVTP